MNEESKDTCEVGIPLDELPTAESSTHEPTKDMAQSSDASAGLGEASLLDDLFDPEEFSSTDLAIEAKRTPEPEANANTDNGMPKMSFPTHLADESDMPNGNVDQRANIRETRADDGIAEQRLCDGLASLSRQMTELQREFEGKLKYDAHKDQIIDRLHAELQEYKQNILKKHILSIVMDVVKVADDIRKWLTYFRSLEVSQRDPRKLFRYLEAIPSDLEDVFYWYGVKPFSNHEGPFDPKRQRAIKQVPTTDPTLDKCVADSIRPGYEWDTKVVRQEMVAVYVHQEAQESTNTGMIDE